MAEVVHDVHHNDTSGSSLGLVVGIVLIAILALFLFYFFGRGFNFGGTTNPGISVPEQVDVNVNQPGGQGGQ